MVGHELDVRRDVQLLTVYAGTSFACPGRVAALDHKILWETDKQGRDSLDVMDVRR